MNDDIYSKIYKQLLLEDCETVISLIYNNSNN